MILKQYYLGCLAHASYLVGDESSGAAAVVDPQRDIDQYLDDARHQNLTIRYVFLTHFHADFVAGHLELRARTGATICLGARARAGYEFLPVGDHQTVELGKLRLEVLETPGHSPESISILVYDLARSPKKPYAVLTGDTLFIGDVGRPDLRAALGWSAEALARLLYQSLRKKLLSLPDETLVYPAHGAGSLCGRSLSTETVSTIGVQRRYNYALQPMGEDTFVKLVTSGLPDAPAYFTYDAVLNTQHRETLDEALARGCRPLALDEVLRLRNAGAQILDVREPSDYAGAHLVGSINISLRGQFASWAGTLLNQHQPIVLIAPAGLEREAAMRLGRIGLDRVAGYLEDGMQALDARRDLLRRTNRITAATLAEQLAAPEPPLILDVRSLVEWAQKHIAGSLNIPLNHLQERIADLPATRRIVVHCQTGYRSSIASSLLARHGLEDFLELLGGYAAWEASGLPSSVAQSALSASALSRRE